MSGILLVVLASLLAAPDNYVELPKEDRPIAVEQWDLVGALETFIDEQLIGMELRTFDMNGFWFKEGEVQFTENGTPDAAEFMLLEAVLEDPKVQSDLRGKIDYDQVLESWTLNLKQVQKELGSADERSPAALVLAAYMTIGDFGSVRLAQHFARAMFEKELDANNYDFRESRHLRHDGNASHDGHRNDDCWESITENVGRESFTEYAMKCLGKRVVVPMER